jgi:transposase-like protein
MPKHKSEDFKMSAVEYYLTEDVSQEQVCRIFKCNPRSLMRWVEKYENIFKGAYNRNAVYVKNKTRKNNTKKYK